MSEQKNFEWQRRKDGPPWEVIDWAGRKHTFATEADGIAFIERDKRMISQSSDQARSDATEQMTRQFETDEEDDGEQAVESSGEVETSGEVVGRKGNRSSRRRVTRAANRKTTAG